MKSGGRIVNVSSQSGNLEQFGLQLQARFREPRNTLSDIEALALEYEVQRPCPSLHSLNDHCYLVSLGPLDFRSPPSLPFLQAFKEIDCKQATSLTNTATHLGWARKPYFVSKALETAMTIALAREHKGLFINACCPGWVSTALGNQAGKAPKTLGGSLLLLPGDGVIGYSFFVCVRARVRARVCVRVCLMCMSLSC